jgi:anaerobic selenocysteine-containing dehydrogenase
MLSNAAAISAMGADPFFPPGGNLASGELKGARNGVELKELLAEGRIRAALLIGEDPLGYDRTASYFRNLEFLAAVDWTDTETTQLADIVLPGSTYLETEGTRFDFEGRLVEYARAIDPPSGISGREVLERLAETFGTSGSIKAMASARGKLPRYQYGQLMAPDVSSRPGSIPPTLTHSSRYKSAILAVGTGRFRVRS